MFSANGAGEDIILYRKWRLIKGYVGDTVSEICSMLCGHQDSFSKKPCRQLSLWRVSSREKNRT
jgi:hypothetical protein